MKNIYRNIKIIKIYNDVEKTTKIWEFPNILIICLNRYNNNNQKISKNIDFDYEINLKKYGVVKQNNIYELYSICNHYGSTTFGHYTSICKKI